MSHIICDRESHIICDFLRLLQSYRGGKNHDFFKIKSWFFVFFGFIVFFGFLVNFCFLTWKRKKCNMHIAYIAVHLQTQNCYKSHLKALNKLWTVLFKKIYSFIEITSDIRTAHVYNQSTGYTKYGPPAQHAG